MVPIFILSRDRLGCLRQLLSWLETAADVRDIVIIDQFSTYPKLLDFYRDNPHYTVVPALVNPPDGAPESNAFREWNTRWPSARYAVITDPDIIPQPYCPKDLLAHCISGLQGHPWATRAGPSLDISDLPAHFAYRNDVWHCECAFWTRQADAQWFVAGIGSTFAVYDRNRLGQPPDPHGIDALRANYPYVARHTTWYQNLNALPEDEDWYLAHGHVSKATSWYGGHKSWYAPVVRRDALPSWEPRVWMNQYEINRAHQILQLLAGGGERDQI